MTVRSDLLLDLHALVAMLGDEEVRVLAYLGRRLLDGQRVYGRLALVSDRRDLEAERGAELADAAVYHGMLEVRRLLVAERERAERGGSCKG